MRKFELPYNFDKNLLLGYQLLGINIDQIDCIYVPPFIKDYQTILRNGGEDTYTLLSYEEYLDHIKNINTIFPNKLQLLLQRTNEEYNMSSSLIKKYINLGFRNFCVGNIEQAKIIKEIDPKIKIVGSIAMHITYEKILSNFDIYKKYFNSFVLDFSYNKNITKIKQMPKDFEYMLLVNSGCNIHCDGDRHWWHWDNFKCPGRYPDVPYGESCLIRPVDLYIFEPYIGVFKIQDRGWPTSEILTSTCFYCCGSEFYMGPAVADSSIYSYNLIDLTKKI